MMDHSGVNAAAFDAILGASFGVHLNDANVDIMCRALPLSTLMDTLAQVVISTRAEVLAARAEFVRALDELSRGDPEHVTAENTKQFLGVALPLLTGAAARVPELLNRILRDVILGAEPEKAVNALSLNDASCVLDAVLSRLDVPLVAEHLRRLFFGATTLVTAARAKPQASATPT